MKPLLHLLFALTIFGLSPAAAQSLPGWDRIVKVYSDHMVQPSDGGTLFWAMTSDPVQHRIQFILPDPSTMLDYVFLSFVKRGRDGAPVHILTHDMDPANTLDDFLRVTGELANWLTGDPYIESGGITWIKINKDWVQLYTFEGEWIVHAHGSVPHTYLRALTHTFQPPAGATPAQRLYIVNQDGIGTITRYSLHWCAGDGEIVLPGTVMQSCRPDGVWHGYGCQSQHAVQLLDVRDCTNKVTVRVAEGRTINRQPEIVLDANCDRLLLNWDSNEWWSLVPDGCHW